MSTPKKQPIKSKLRKERAKAVKVSHAQFFSILRENAGLFSRTARAISMQFGVPYTRQAVRDRAVKHPAILADIEEENLDIAEEGLTTIMRSKSETIRLDAVKYYLDRKGKKRGYHPKATTDIIHSGEMNFTVDPFKQIRANAEDKKQG